MKTVCPYTTNSSQTSIPESHRSRVFRVGGRVIWRSIQRIVGVVVVFKPRMEPGDSEAQTT
jgi:hypothetical protein